MLKDSEEWGAPPSRWVKPKMSNFLSWHEADPLPEMEEGKDQGKEKPESPFSTPPTSSSPFLPCGSIASALPQPGAQPLRKAQTIENSPACPPPSVHLEWGSGPLGQYEQSRHWEFVFAPMVAGCGNGGPTEGVRVPPK